VHHFSGDGYILYPRINPFYYRSSTKFAIRLEFKTFWDDSQLFFAGNPDVNYCF
jgi:hypothetical protein